MHKALYRSFRPETFDGLLGQNHIVKILKNQIAQGTTGHAYLFCGTRGTGKTSTARILAKGVNCTADHGNRPCGICANCQSIRDGVFLDVIEIDAASNNGVDNIRELRESVNYPPVTGRCKVYIIDEVHMLTTPAFNALLKTLEEPPESVMFILATTEPQKLPATILSRCLRLDFRRVSEQILKEGLKRICNELSVSVAEGAIGLIAANADGSVRDALSLLDQCISSGEKEINREDVLDFLGTSGESFFLALTDAVNQGKTADALVLLSQALSEGKEVRQLMKDWIAHFRNLLILNFAEDPEELLNMSAENIDRIRSQSAEMNFAKVDRSIRELSETLSEAKWSAQPRILLELCIVRLATADAPRTQVEAAAPSVQAQPAMKAQSAVEAQPAAKVAEVAPRVQEIEELWSKVTQAASSERSNLSMLKKRSVLTAQTEREFLVEFSSEISLKLAEDNAELLETLVERFGGKRLQFKGILNEKTEPEAPKKTREHLANEISGALGIKVDLE